MPCSYGVRLQRPPTNRANAGLGQAPQVLCRRGVVMTGSAFLLTDYGGADLGKSTLPLTIMRCALERRTHIWCFARRGESAMALAINVNGSTHSIESAITRLRSPGFPASYLPFIWVARARRRSSLRPSFSSPSRLAGQASLNGRPAGNSDGTRKRSQVSSSLPPLGQLQCPIELSIRAPGPAATSNGKLGGAIRQLHDHPSDCGPHDNQDTTEVELGLTLP
jgi:hypothetical protein